jgi:hypothetical protein
VISGEQLWGSASSSGHWRRPESFHHGWASPSHHHLHVLVVGFDKRNQGGRFRVLIQTVKVYGCNGVQSLFAGSSRHSRLPFRFIRQGVHRSSSLHYIFTWTYSPRNANGSISGLKKSDTSKNPRYINTCMDELFPVRKNSTRLRLLCKKEIAKSRRFTCFNSSY